MLILHTVTLSEPIAYKPVKGRIVSLANDSLDIRLYTNEGVFLFRLLKDFCWNGRSGGPFVDFIAPNQGTQMESAMWAFHDCSGYPNTISPDISGELLRQFAIKMNGYNSKTALLIKKSVNAVSSKWKAYEWEEVDKEYVNNFGRYKFEWLAK